MPVPSGKEGCANRAAIDLLVANPGNLVLADFLLKIGSMQSLGRSLLRFRMHEIPSVSFGSLSAEKTSAHGGIRQ
jgi:hypothetical protein